MSEEVFWTILFGALATAIGLTTIWQNRQIVMIREAMREYSTYAAEPYLCSLVLDRYFHPRRWYGQ
jgi:hypothetical protein